ncbi:ABC transporter substrate-binding protein [Defluviitalea phaphyphila]|uniref:ABC transporter substrate-binding protein n=1 Tax=Defluviitalea phaphyphila TaxID=1473580 RepID=UPI0007310E30|nr:ABC transporter substrate-binding protein [Defluviitalea phaphyphila]
MKKTKKIISLLLIVGLMISTLVACGNNEENSSQNSGETSSESSSGETSSESNSEDSDVIKIGGIAPLTGGVAVYGVAADNGVKLAVKEINANGGILGKQIEYISYDDKGDTTEAVNAYKKLTSNDEVDAIIGAVTSKPTLAVTPLAAKDKIPMISPTATALDVTQAGDNIFRACFIDPYQGEVMAKFAVEELNVSKVAILYNTADDYSTGVAEAFKEAVERSGVEVVNFEGYNGDDKDFKAILTNVKSQNPEAVFIPDYYKNLGTILPQAKELGITATFLGADGWDGVLTVAPEAAEGAYFCSHYSPEDESEEVQNFLKMYKEEYGEDPVSFAALGYDAMKILAAAIEKAGSTDKEAVIEALAETNITSVTGNITFDENRNPIKDAAIIKIEGGKNTLFTKVSLKEDLVQEEEGEK